MLKLNLQGCHKLETSSHTKLKWEINWHVWKVITWHFKDKLKWDELKWEIISQNTL